MSVTTLTSNPGDIAWIITATALVMLMTPALGFFYGGLVRRKNLVSTIAQCFIIFAVISLTWALWGYSYGLWTQLPRHNRKPLTRRVKRRRHTRHQPCPSSNNTHTTLLRVSVKVRSNHTRPNHRCMR